MKYLTGILLLLPLVAIRSEVSDVVLPLFQFPDIYRPIQYVNFQKIGNSLLCVASSSFRLTYRVTVIENTSGNNVKIRGRSVLFSGSQQGKAIVGCEVETKLYNKVYTKFTYYVWSFSPHSELPPRFEFVSHEGKGYLRYKGEFVCPKFPYHNSNQYARIICTSLGYTNLDAVSEQRHLIAPENEDNKRHFISCTYDSSLGDCTMSKEDRTQRNYYSYNDNKCNSVLKVDCGSTKRAQYPTVSEASSLKPSLVIHPNRQIEESDQVEVNCSANFKFHQRQMIQLNRIRSNGSKTNFVNSLDDITMGSTDDSDIFQSYSFKYEATRDLINDTFVCSVQDLVSLTTQSVQKVLTYKMSFTKININLYRKTNYSSELVEVTDNEKHLADLARCQADSEQPMPQYHWSYLDKEGEERTNTSKYLDLTNVEKRVPITCQVQQTLRSASFNGTATESFYENGNKSSNVSTFYKNKLQLCDQSKILSCGENYELVFESLKVGYVKNCGAILNNCKFKEGLEYYRTEKCQGVYKCDITTAIFKKLLFSALMKNVLPKECLSGDKPYLELSYYCLRKEF